MENSKKHYFLLLFVISMISVFLIGSLAFAGGKPAPTSTTTPLTLKKHNIVTAQPDGGRLNVWGRADDATYSKLWSVNNVSYASVAIGNVDSTADREIVAVNVCKISTSKSSYYYKLFINAYKEGANATYYPMGVWATTYYDDVDLNNIKETNNGWLTGITLADLDGDEQNEVVVMTASSLAVYKFGSDITQSSTTYPPPNNQAFKRVAYVSGVFTTKDNSVVNERLSFFSLAAKDANKVVGSPGQVVVIARRASTAESYLLRWDYDFGFTAPKQEIVLGKAALPFNGLSFGSSDGLSPASSFLVASFSKQNNGFYQNTLRYWKLDATNNIVETTLSNDFPIGEPSTSMGHAYVAAGDLGGNLGDEVAVAENTLRDKVSIYGWTNGTLSFIGFFEPQPTYIVNIADVVIADADGDRVNELIVGGGGGFAAGGKNSGSPGGLYFEVYHPSDDASTFTSEGNKLGGSNDDTGAWNIAVD